MLGIPVAFDLVGIFAFAISGGLMAVRKDFDIVGVVILAVITALGGGVLRDLVLGDTPPVAFSSWPYLAIAFVGAGLVFVAHSWLRRLTGALLIFDAAGLGLFCVASTIKALDFGLQPVGAATLGVTTAVGGGALRDVIAREVPALVSPTSELYAVPALTGALFVAVIWHLGHYVPIVGASTAIAIFAVRLLAMRYRWTGPRPHRP